MESQATAHILVVDDSIANVEMLRGYLTAAGYEISGAYDGRQALAKVAEEPVDLILLDIMMPVLNGYEVCRRLKGDPATQFIPIVMLTALRELEDKVEGLEAGADEFLSKPFNKLELLTRVKSLLRVKALHDELERSYRDLERQHEELRRLERLKDDLTHLIIHDINNFLTAIAGNLSLVLRRRGVAELPPLHQRQIKTAYDSARQLGRLARDLLDVTKMERGELPLKVEDLDVADVVRAGVQVMQDAADEGQREVMVDLPPSLPVSRADRALLLRVIINLLSNALKYTPQGGHIAISVEADAPNRQLLVSVADDGRGIPAEYHQAIFEKFRQVEAKADEGRTGTGLGLTFCKLAVEAHGGHIWVESAPGQGTTFRFTLPISVASDQLLP